MFDNYLDVIFNSFNIQECLDIMNDETTAEAGWNEYVDMVGGDAPENNFRNEVSTVRDQWDYNELSKLCETFMRNKMKNLSLNELLVALESGEEVMDYADEGTKQVYAAWQLQQKLLTTLSEKKLIQSVKI